MNSLKSLKLVHLQFALDSRCSGLDLVRRLGSAKLRTTNPDCKVEYQARALASPS